MPDRGPEEARRRIEADPGPGDDAAVLTRGELAQVWQPDGCPVAPDQRAGYRHACPEHPRPPAWWQRYVARLLGHRPAPQQPQAPAGGQEVAARAYDVAVDLRCVKLTRRRARRQVRLLFGVIDHLLNTHIPRGDDAGVCRRCGNPWPCSVVADIGEQLTR
jgi:hypothetical protein